MRRPLELGGGLAHTWPTVLHEHEAVSHLSDSGGLLTLADIMLSQGAYQGADGLPSGSRPYGQRFIKLGHRSPGSSYSQGYIAGALPESTTCRIVCSAPSRSIFRSRSSVSHPASSVWPASAACRITLSANPEITGTGGPSVLTVAAYSDSASSSSPTCACHRTRKVSTSETPPSRA